MMRSVSTSGRGRRAPVARFAAAVWVILTLAACQQERAVPVPFPDDPRVLNGSWELKVTGLQENVQRTVLSADGQRLLAVRSERAWLYQRDLDGSWHEGDVSPYSAHLKAQEDPSLDALVALKRSSRDVTVSIVSLADASETTSTITLPEGLTFDRMTVGSGRFFALLSDAAGARQLYWFDLVTGAAEGSYRVPAHNQGMRVSANGRMISFWSMPFGSAASVWLLDTAQPAEPLGHVSLGILCTAAGIGQSSDDGRWFLGIDCAGNLQVLDLHEANPRWRAIGVKLQGFPKFARGSNHLVVWHDDAGRVRSHDVAGTGGTTTLASDVRPGGYLHDDVLQVNVPAGLVLADDGHGRIAVAQLDHPEARLSLPKLPVTSAVLDLTATDLYSDQQHSFYSVTGTFEAEGEQLELEGRVFSHYFHDYITSAAAPPPRLEGRTEMRSPSAAGDDEPLYRLEFSSEDRNAVSYDGTLWDDAQGLTYTVRLQRVDP